MADMKSHFRIYGGLFVNTGKIIHSFFLQYGDLLILNMVGTVECPVCRIVRAAREYMLPGEVQFPRARRLLKDIRLLAMMRFLLTMYENGELDGPDEEEEEEEEETEDEDGDPGYITQELSTSEGSDCERA